MQRVLVLIGLIVCTAACATSGEDTADPARATAPRTSSRTPPPSGSSSTPATTPPKRPARLPSRPTDVFTRTRVAGMVVVADASCVLVEDAHGIRWSLELAGMPGSTDLRVGQQIQVTGRSRPEPARGSADNACEGIPLVVERLDPGA